MSRERDNLETLLQQLITGLADGSTVLQPGDAPLPPDPDVNASAEVAGLTPTARQEYAHRQLIQRLEAQAAELSTRIETQESELAELRQLRVAHETLRYSHRSARWVGAVCVVAMAIGGGLVSTFPTSHVGFGVGWGLLIVASLVQLGKSVLDW